MHPAEFGKLAARNNLVEIAEACRREAKLFKLDGQDPASVQPVEMLQFVAANLLNRLPSGIGRLHSR